MVRSRIEALLGVVAVVLSVMTLIWPTWIEELTGRDPDNGSGQTEWWLAMVFALVALGFFLLSWRSRRRGKLRAAPASG